MEKTALPISYQDGRGIIKDILAGVPIDAITYITSKKGAIRGNHYHKKTHQYDYILKGSLLCVSRKGERGKKVKTIARAGDLLYHAPGEQHGYKAREDAEFITFTYGPRRGKEYESDVYRLRTPLVQ